MTDKRQHVSIIILIVFLLVLTLVISPPFNHVSFPLLQDALEEESHQRRKAPNEFAMRSIDSDAVAVNSYILQFYRKLSEGELQLLEKSLGVAISYKFDNFPLYVVSRVSSERLSELPSLLKDLMRGIYPNVSHRFPLIWNLDAGSKRSSAFQEITLDDVTTFRQRLLEQVGADALYVMGVKGENVTIGIIDTGVNPNHQELQGKVITMKSFVKKELGYSETIENATDSFGSNGHGTGVASLIVGKNLGMAPKARLISAKVIHDFSVRGAANGSAEETTAGVLAAIDFLVSQQVDIISISLGQYINLPNVLRDLFIDNVSKNKGIVFVTAAGNFGYHLIGGSSVSTPGTSLQAITVGSANWDLVPSFFSSEGPRSDGAMKPDLLAPGEDILLASSWNETGYAKGSGTSFATPIVAGIIALLVSGIRNYHLGIRYSPGLLKAALLNSAHLLVGEKCRYPSWKQGLGMVDAVSAWKVILDSPVDNISKIPILSFLIPKEPSIPTFKIFYRDQTQYLPLTIVSSLPVQVKTVRAFLENGQSLKTIGDGSLVIQGKDTLFFTVNLYVPSSIPEGLHELSITVETNNTQINLKSHWRVKIGTPHSRVLIDTSHAMFAQRGIGSYHSILGNTATVYGGFRELSSLLLEQGIAVEMRNPNQMFNLSYLSQYDAYFLIEPTTRSWHPFMDWMPPSSQYLNLDDEEITTILNYSRQGGKVVVLLRGQPVVNVTNVNMLLDDWGVLLENDTETYRSIRITENHLTTLNVSASWEATVQTGSLQIINETTVMPLIIDSTSNQVVGTIHYVDANFTTPDVIVLATSSLFDNFGLEGVYDSKSSDIKTNDVVMNLISWVLGIVPLNDAGDYLVIDNCKGLIIDTVSEINSESIGLYLPIDPTFQILLGVVVLSVGVSIIKLYKVRNKKDE